MRTKAKFEKPLKWRCWHCADERAALVRNGISQHELKKFDAYQRSFNTKAEYEGHVYSAHRRNNFLTTSWGDPMPCGEQMRNTVKRRREKVLARIKTELQRGADTAGAGTIV